MTPNSSPLVIGVAGGSGPGETTVVRRIVETIGGREVTVIEHDRYCRDHPELRLEERAALNYDHPDSLETDPLVAHVRCGKAGRGRFVEPSKRYADLIVPEGGHNQVAIEMLLTLIRSLTR